MNARILVLVGPTASGKTDLSVEIAQAFNGEIVNADSRQFYKELHIGTAKPSPEIRERIPHHLVDCASILESWTVAKFIEEADQAIQNILSRRKVPVIVGGTGLYVRGLLFGIDGIPQIESSLKKKLQNELEQNGLSALYAELQKVDPEYADVLSSQDKQRILRALEVYHQTGKRIRDFWKEGKKTPRYDPVKMGVDVEREELYGRINKRMDDMVKQGLKAEVLALHEKWPQNVILEKTIGYAEWIRHAFKDDDRIVDEIKKNSRHFAKRQLTWFRHEDDISWAVPGNILKVLRGKL